LNFENRVVQALFCGRPVFSEPLSGNLLRSGRDYVPVHSPADLCEKVTSFLGRGEPAPAPEVNLANFTIDALLRRLNCRSALVEPDFTSDLVSPDPLPNLPVSAG
jgi:hypothetical protein